MSEKKKSFSCCGFDFDNMNEEMMDAMKRFTADGKNRFNCSGMMGMMGFMRKKNNKNKESGKAESQP